MSTRVFLVAAAVVVLAVGALVGLRAGGAAAGHASTTATSPQPTVSTQQRVVMLPTPTTPAFDLPGYDRPPVHLGDMNTTEQFIIGELYQLALEQQGYQVVPNPNIGAPPYRAAAMQQGSLDLYPDYLDQWNAEVAHLGHRYQSLRASYGAGSAYARSHGYVLLKPAPCSCDTNPSGIAVTSEYATQNHIRSISDLAHGPQISIGVPQELQVPSGLPTLKRAYGLDPFVQPVLIGSEYHSLEDGSVQAAYVTTTDPNLDGPEYRELRDPKHVFGFGNIVPVTTAKVLAQEGPAFSQTINRVDAILTTRAVRGLNTEVVTDHRKVPIVAQQFLQGNGILPVTVFRPARQVRQAR
jgi:osmoprotectant transport system substrate-binding protein